jgi:hypothetical protein
VKRGRGSEKLERGEIERGRREKSAIERERSERVRDTVGSLVRPPLVGRDE